MTNEERDLITRFIERVSGAGPAAGGGSVPQAGQAGLAPVDPEADALIGQLMTQHAEARYRITQLAFVQEHALAAAQQRIAALQAELQQAQAAGGGQQAAASPWGAAAAPQQQQQSQSHGFFSSLFGGGGGGAPSRPQAPSYQPPPQYAPPQPQYAPQPYPQQGGGMFQPQGTGFLGGALRTAAGVAGGLVAGQALMSLFEGNRGGGFGGFGSETGMPGGGFEQGGGFGTPGGWTDAGQGGGFTPDPFDQGGALKGDPGSDPYAAGQGGADNAGWAPAPDQSGGDTGWQQPASDDGGWQQPASDDSSFDTGSNSDDGGWTDSSSDA